jgi:EAL domain-containing protein (putative c-di-GMP-specific phosphodiesterase class I)
MEANGRSADLTRHCMRHIARDFPLMLNGALSNAENVDALHLNLNLSGCDLTDTRLVEDLSEIADRAGISPCLVHLELTETGLARTFHDTNGALHAARRLGFGVAIDDFGTGYSTMASLRDTPADTLKIDRSFVQGLGDGGVDLSIVKNILLLAKELEMKVVAEGVETANDVSALRALECDFGQGFRFGRPQPIEQTVAFVRSWRRDAAMMPGFVSSRGRAHVA